MRFLLCATVLLLAAAVGGQSAPVRLNDVQMLGSHNSYKLAIAPDNLAALRASDPELAEALDYWHPPLREQLDLGLRKLELDVFYDPGGRLFDRAVAAAGTSAFPVLHVQNLDDRSHCANLLECLAHIVAWSDAHPDHLPLFVSFNAKDAVIDRPGFLRPEPFGEDAWMALDAELRAGLGGRLLTPADVFVDGRLNWPPVDAARGRVVTILDEGGDKRRQYADGWQRRAMFATLPEGSEGAAIMIVNDPVADFTHIQRLVQAGYIVRTRADADTREARSGSVERRDLAFASGAQLVSTDYYLPAERFGTGYHVTMPGNGIARCNPLRVTGVCPLPEAQGASASR